MTPFQCDWCLFWLITGQIPSSSYHQDEFFMCLLRWANLMCHGFVKVVPWQPIIEIQTSLSGCGLNKFAQNLLYRSCDPLQPLTNLVLVWQQECCLSPSSLGDITSIVSSRLCTSCDLHIPIFTLHLQKVQQPCLCCDTAKVFLTSCAKQSLWFEFTKGCLRCMGQEVCQDLALSVKDMLALLELLDSEQKNAIRARWDAITLIGACFLCHGIWRILQRP